MLTPSHLTNLLDLARAAAPGPWEFEHRHTDRRYGGHVYSKVEEGPGEFEAFDGSYHGRLIAESLSREHATYFAALSPEVVIALVERIRELEEGIRGQGWCPCDDCKPSGLKSWARELLEPTPTPGAIIDAEFDEVNP
jgi:hypothetical protein